MFACNYDLAGFLFFELATLLAAPVFDIAGDSDHFFDFSPSSTRRRMAGFS
jgi:hypothetical protein